MTPSNQHSKMWPVLGAAAVIVVLAGSLGARLIGRDTVSVSLPSPSATVPAPTELEVADLEVPVVKRRRRPRAQRRPGAEE